MRRPATSGMKSDEILMDTAALRDLRDTKREPGRAVALRRSDGHAKALLLVRGESQREVDAGCCFDCSGPVAVGRCWRVEAAAPRSVLRPQDVCTNSRPRCVVLTKPTRRHDVRVHAFAVCQR